MVNQLDRACDLMSSVPGREPEEPKEASRLEWLSQRVNTNAEYPRWVAIVRQLAIFLLGVWIITYSVSANSKNIAYIITGLILIGIIPVETMLLAVTRRRKRDE